MNKQHKHHQYTLKGESYKRCKKKNHTHTQKQPNNTHTQCKQSRAELTHTHTQCKKSRASRFSLKTNQMMLSYFHSLCMPLTEYVQISVVLQLHDIVVLFYIHKQALLIPKHAIFIPKNTSASAPASTSLSHLPYKYTHMYMRTHAEIICPFFSHFSIVSELIYQLNIVIIITLINNDKNLSDPQICHLNYVLITFNMPGVTQHARTN